MRKIWQTSFALWSIIIQDLFLAIAEGNFKNPYQKRKPENTLASQFYTH